MTQASKVLVLWMFVRKKRNRSGTTSVVVVRKTGGKFQELKTIGISNEQQTIEQYIIEGHEWIRSQRGIQDIFKRTTQEQEAKQVTDLLLSNIENILLNGIQLLLEKVFGLTGFDKIEDDILRHLVIARLSQPMSKSATVEYLKSHFDEDVKLHKIYRYLDKLYNSQQEQLQQISVAHTKRILGGKIGLLFYDVTTLYFESDNSDELRERGFSKDGKHSHPQIVLGLLVSKDAYPLSYSIFNGAQYEGRTMLPIVEDFVQRFQLDDFVIVADSGLMSQSTLTLLESGGYKYILGARIKNESAAIKQAVLSMEKQDHLFHEIKKGDARLIINYSSKRAKKDSQNREKGVKRLKKAYQTGRITKENINKRGYNKFLEITENVKVSINEERIKEDQQWDGLKGYVTNTSLSAREIYDQYNGLWAIEKAFRITKGTLDIRPMFHFTPKRIEAHVCICFVAYKVYKELERILKVSNINMSPDNVLSIAKTITTIRVKLPISGQVINKTMFLTPKHQAIALLFDENFWKNFQGDA